MRWCWSASLSSDVAVVDSYVEVNLACNGQRERVSGGLLVWTLE